MIVGLGGYAGSGKDAFADAMIQCNPVWSKTYMSYALEQALLALDPYVPVPRRFNFLPRKWMRYSELHEAVGYTDSKKNLEARRLLQNLGTEVGRKMFGEDVWVEKMMEVASEHDFVIVTGIRYKNEIDAVTNSGGVTAWVHRPGVGPINSHSSDNSLDSEMFEHFIENAGTLPELASIAKRFSRQMIKLETLNQGA